MPSEDHPPPHEARLEVISSSGPSQKLINGPETMKKNNKPKAVLGTVKPQSICIVNATNDSHISYVTYYYTQDMYKYVVF